MRSSRGSSQPRDQTQVSHSSQILSTREDHGKCVCAYFSSTQPAYVFWLVHLIRLPLIIDLLLLSVSHSVMFHSFWPHELQHANLPCPSLSPRTCSNSCLLSLWCHPTISSSVVPFSYLNSFVTSGSFPVNQLLASGGQSIGASASTSVLSVNIQDWFHLGLAGLISFQSKGLSRVFSQHHGSKASVLQCSTFFMVQLWHSYINTGKTTALTRWTLSAK